MKWAVSQRVIRLVGHAVAFLVTLASVASAQPRPHVVSPSLSTGSVGASSGASKTEGTASLLVRAEGASTAGISPKSPSMSKGGAPVSPSPATKKPAVGTFGRLPVAFIENRGQLDGDAKFYLSTGGETLRLTPGGIIFDFRRATDVSDHVTLAARRDPDLPFLTSVPREQPEVKQDRLVISQDIIGADPKREIEARSPLPGTYNYLLRNDPAKWLTGVKGYGELVYRDAWPGIDVKLSGNRGSLDHD